MSSTFTFVPNIQQLVALMRNKTIDKARNTAHKFCSYYSKVAAEGGVKDDEAVGLFQHEQAWLDRSFAHACRVWKFFMARWLFILLGSCHRPPTLDTVNRERGFITFELRTFQEETETLRTSCLQDWEQCGIMDYITSD